MAKPTLDLLFELRADRLDKTNVVERCAYKNLALVRDTLECGGSGYFLRGPKFEKMQVPGAVLADSLARGTPCAPTLLCLLGLEVPRSVPHDMILGRFQRLWLDGHAAEVSLLHEEGGAELRVMWKSDERRPSPDFQQSWPVDPSIIGNSMVAGVSPLRAVLDALPEAAEVFFEHDPGLAAEAERRELCTSVSAPAHRARADSRAL